MTHRDRPVGLLAVCAPVVLALVTWACDQELYTATDAEDTVTALDTVEDTFEEEPVEECMYPEGPYAFDAVGNVVGPMAWPTAVAGIDETLAADLAALHCDPSIKSIFIQIAAIS